MVRPGASVAPLRRAGGGRTRSDSVRAACLTPRGDLSGVAQVFCLIRLVSSAIWL